MSCLPSASPRSLSAQGGLAFRTDRAERNAEMANPMTAPLLSPSASGSTLPGTVGGKRAMLASPIERALAGYAPDAVGVDMQATRALERLIWTRSRHCGLQLAATTTHDSPAHHSLRTTHRAPLTAHHSSLTT